MIIRVYVGDQTFPIEVQKLVLEEGDDFFSMIDRDLETGYQVSRTWIQKPTANCIAYRKPENSHYHGRLYLDAHA